VKVKELLSVPFTHPEHSEYGIYSKEYKRVPKDKECLFYECNIVSLSGGGFMDSFISIYCDGFYKEMVGELDADDN
jgi:hypothetical protein